MTLSIRIGQGYDIHRLIPIKEGSEQETPLTLGGFGVPQAPFAVVAHSDGDVVLHALMDALLGAMALGDIGDHFPPSNPAFAGANSQELLTQTLALLAQQGAAPVQMDATVVLEQPKLGPYKQAIRASLAQLLQLPLSQVSFKAKTAEGLGPLGTSQAVAASVTVLVQVCE
ncbi:MAG: 2-C-methyl-D-erythritol 2,4-cyclodiphosphate synthase [Vampirovibrionales bacterium]